MTKRQVLGRESLPCLKFVNIFSLPLSMAWRMLIGFVEFLANLHCLLRFVQCFLFKQKEVCSFYFRVSYYKQCKICKLTGGCYDLLSGIMESSSNQSGGILWFFRDKGFDDKIISEMFRRCKRLEGVQREKASESWDFLKSIGIQERKLPSIVTKCPKILTFGVDERLEPMVHCLQTLATKPTDVPTAIIKFPYIFSHSVEEKLCPLLAFFESLGIPDKQLGKMILLNPRIISYSIESKLVQFVDFLASLELNKDGMIGKILAKNPYLMGYSVSNRLQPTVEFLKEVGLAKPDIQKLTVAYPEVLCRDVNKTLKPNHAYLKSSGFDDKQIAALVTGYPPILIKSIKNSLEPKIKFLVEVMGRRIDEVVDYPDFFRYGLKKTLEFRQRIMTQRNLDCSLNEMLYFNQKKFSQKYGLLENLG